MPETFFFYKTRNICSYIGVKNASTSHFADCAKPTAKEQLNVSASNFIGYDDGCVVSITFFFLSVLPQVPVSFFPLLFIRLFAAIHTDTDESMFTEHCSTQIAE